MGSRVDSRRLYRLSENGALSDFGTFRTSESYNAPLPEGGFVMLPVPYGRSSSVAVNGDSWFYTNGIDYRIEERDTLGRLRAIYRYGAQPRGSTEEDRTRFLAKRLEDVKGQPSRVEDVIRDIPLPERMPADRSLIIDDENNVWAALYADGDGPSCWHVYLQQPKPTLARVCLPPRFTLFDVRANNLVGIDRDEFDVERIARYAVRK